MSMREILGTLNESYPDVGLEDAGVAAEEKEYGYFVELTEPQLNAMLEEFASCEKEAFLEARVPCNIDNMKARVREYYEADGRTVDKRVYTVKKYEGEKCTKLEEDNDIGEFGFMALLSTAPSYTSRVRINIPSVVRTTGETRKKRDGSDLCWEIDVYTTKSGKPSLWVKAEMEVDVVAVDSIVELMPFEFTNVIDADSADDTDREFIDHLYAVEYNMK